MLDNKNDSLADHDEAGFTHYSEQKKDDSRTKAIRRSIEDILAERALRKRLTDVFDDDFLLE